MGRKGVISLSLPCPDLLKAVRAKAQGRILEVGTDAEAVEGVAYWLVSTCCFIVPRTTGPGMVLPKNELGPPTSVVNQANEPQAGLVWTSPLRFPFPR